MKTPEELFAGLGNRGEYAALPSITLDEVKMIYREGQNSHLTTMSTETDYTPGPWGVERTFCTNWIGPLRADSHKVSEVVCHTDREGLKIEFLKRNDANAQLIASAPDLKARCDQQHAVIQKLRLAINEAIAISGTGTPQDWTAAQVGLCRVLEGVKVMLGEKGESA